MALRNLTVNWSYDTSVQVTSFRVFIKDSGGTILNQSNSLGSTIRTYSANNVDVGGISTTLDIVVTSINNDGVTNSEVVQQSVNISPPNAPVITSVVVTQ